MRISERESARSSERKEAEEFLSFIVQKIHMAADSDTVITRDGDSLHFHGRRKGL